MKFRAIGPATSGGRVPAVAGSDRDPALYYVGGAGGGVFKSSDGGTSFQSVWTGASKFGAIGAIAIAPSDDKTVWVGTGETNPRNDVSYGDGVWVTHDGAKHWTHAGLDDTSTIAKILVDPKNAKRAIVAALGDPWKDSSARGVYVTNDGGRTWSKTLYVGPASGAADLAWNPKQPQTVFAAIWQFRREPWIATSGGPADGLYRSRDGGRTWAKIAGHGFPTDTLGRIGVAVAPSDPKRVYAVVQSKQGTVWRSDDGGDSWQRVSSNTLPEQRPFYFSHLAVDPRNEKRVIAVSMYLTLSKDGGRTWKHQTGAVHVDNHVLWWSADGTRLIEGNDGGVILSRNGGDSWAFLDRIPLAQIYHVGFSDEKPYLICGGLQDNSSWCAPTTSRNGIGLINRDWFAIAGGDGMYAVPDPVDPNFIWTNTQDGVLGIYDQKARQSTDVSPYPRDVFTSATSFAESKYRFNWNAPLAFSPQDGHVAYFGGNVVFKTTDRGRHWTPISPDLTRNEKEHQRNSGGPINLDVSGAEYYDTTLALAPSPKDANLIWAGTDDGLIHLTRDGGAHWSERHAAELAEVRARRGDRGEPARRGHGVHAARPARSGRPAPVRVRHRRLRRDVAFDRGELAARRARARGAARPARAEPAVRGHRERAVDLVRPRRPLGASASRLPGRAGVRHPRAPVGERSARRDARPRLLRARRSVGAAAARRGAARGRAVLPRARRGACGRAGRRSRPATAARCPRTTSPDRTRRRARC